MRANPEGPKNLDTVSHQRVLWARNSETYILTLGKRPDRKRICDKKIRYVDGDDHQTSEESKNELEAEMRFVAFQNQRLLNASDEQVMCL